MNILITDGENRSSLAATRSLGRAGYSVFVSSKDVENISASSKYCRKAFKTYDPLYDGKRYIQAIEEITKSEKIDIIFPMTEQSIYCLNTNRERLGKNVILACASVEKMEAVSNKYSLFQIAQKLGIAIPETVYVSDAHDYQDKASQISIFPVVVKPAFSKILLGEKILPTGVMYAYNRHELNNLYATKPALRYPSMIQEMITGQGTGLFTLFDKDRHIALFSHRRLLEKPPSGGVSVLSESIALDCEMVEVARKLLTHSQWTGIAMVEFKRDLRDGRAKLMEINGRFWGSLQLAVSSGVNFPVLCLEYYLGRKRNTIMPHYTIGHKLKWTFGILDHLIIRLRNWSNLRNVSPDTSSIWRVLIELLYFGESNTSYDIYDSRDLKPFVAESKLYIRSLLSFK